MKTITDYLDEAKIVTGSDYKTAKRLGIARGHLSTFRYGTSISDDICLRLAELLDIEPIEVIAAKNAERTKSPEMRKKWVQIASHHAAALALVVVSVLAPSEDTQAADSVGSQFDNNRYYAHFSVLLRY